MEAQEDHFFSRHYLRNRLISGVSMFGYIDVN
jgi:hypothetical protein